MVPRASVNGSSYSLSPPTEDPPIAKDSGHNHVLTLLTQTDSSRAQARLGHHSVRHPGQVTAFLIAVAASGLGTTSAHAGPCTSEIAWFEQAVRRSVGNPNAGPMAPQSIGSQLDRQPTPASVKRAQERAQTSFSAAMARAKRLDAQGNRSGCTRALTAAKRMYNL